MSKKWKHTIKIRDILDIDIDWSNRDHERDEVGAAGEKMFLRLAEYEFLNFPNPKRFTQVTTEKGFNKVLDDLFDYCGANDIRVVWS